jgi:hypothetical protein
MWDSVREWLNSELAVQLPQDETLFDDLCGVNKKYDRLGRLQLEEKDEIKKRLGRSPDKGDALALTFAEPVFDMGRPKMYGNGNITFNELFSETRGDSSW